MLSSRVCGTFDFNGFFSPDICPVKDIKDKGGKSVTYNHGVPDAADTHMKQVLAYE